MVKRSRELPKLLYIFADDTGQAVRAKRYINAVIRFRRRTESRWKGRR
jgi:hypothetical protein